MRCCNEAPVKVGVKRWETVRHLALAKAARMGGRLVVTAPVGRWAAQPQCGKQSWLGTGTTPQCACPSGPRSWPRR